MRDMSFYNAGCQPSQGKSRLLVLVRRLFRRILSPPFARLAEILGSIVDRLDADEQKLGEAEAKLAAAVAKLESTGAKLETAEACLRQHISDSQSEMAVVDKRLVLTEGRIFEVEKRADSAEARFVAAETNLGVLFKKSDGLSAHLSGLTADHQALNGQVQSRIVQIETICQATEGLGRRQTELDEKIQAFQALHWDHVALARRLAVIEDLLAAQGGTIPIPPTIEASPSIPFPGLDDQARSQVS